MSIFVTKNFKRAEFRCPCGCYSDRPLDPKLIFLLQSLRDKIDRPIYITKGGGLRCKKYNRKIGGYRYSPHLEGRAVDIHAKNMSLIQLAKESESIRFSRVGLYKNFIHIDVLSPRPSRAWVRNKNGIYSYFSTLEEAITFAKEIGLWYN